MDGQTYHCRDASGLECDAVVHLHNGSYGLIEIKLGGADAGAVNFNKPAEKIDTTAVQAQVLSKKSEQLSTFTRFWCGR